VDFLDFYVGKKMELKKRNWFKVITLVELFSLIKLLKYLLNWDKGVLLFGVRYMLIYFNVLEFLNNL
jgi:hypothetical protein